jgi:predicted DNA-binding mobile mystery protein A
MRKRNLTIVDDMALAQLQSNELPYSSGFSYGHWIRMLRGYLRMTQAELAKRSDITQPNLAAIESEKANPHVSTLKRIYEGLSCDLIVEPRPRRPLHEVLRGRARSIALKRLKQAMGTMALENQAPEKEVFQKLLEKRTDEVLNDPSERLWNKKDE